MTRSAWQRPVLRTDEEFSRHRAVSWLELFFDLVFVVVIARLAHHLAAHVDGAGVLTFAVQFLAVFWVWNSFTYYTERFESEGLENRLLAFLAMVPVAGLAVFSDDGLGSAYIGFALAYLLARLVNQVEWVRAARHVPEFRPVAARFVGGFVVATAIVLVSFAVSGPLRIGLFALAVLLEIVTPSFTVRLQTALPKLSSSKFPERFGLLTMIVLGESVAGVIVGLSELADEHVLDGPGIAAGVVGLAIGFALWWIYFDFVARRSPQPVFITALLWVYLHLVTLTAITATAAGISVVLADSSHGHLAPAGRYLIVGGVVLALLGIAALQTTLLRAADEPTHPVLSPALKVGAAVVVGVLGVLDLGWSAIPLLLLVLAGLVVPMVYGAVVWFASRRPVSPVEP